MIDWKRCSWKNIYLESSLFFISPLAFEIWMAYYVVCLFISSSCSPANCHFHSALLINDVANAVIKRLASSGGKKALTASFSRAPPTWPATLERLSTLLRQRRDWKEVYIGRLTRLLAPSTDICRLTTRILLCRTWFYALKTLSSVGQLLWQQQQQRLSRWFETIV